MYLKCTTSLGSFPSKMRKFRKTEADNELDQLRKGRVVTPAPKITTRQISSNPILSSCFDQDASVYFNPHDASTLRDMQQLFKEFQDDEDSIESYVFKMPTLQTESCTRVTSTVDDDGGGAGDTTVHLPQSSITTNVRKGGTLGDAIVTSKPARLLDIPAAEPQAPQSNREPITPQSSSIPKSTTKIIGRDIYGTQTHHPPQRRPTPSQPSQNIRRTFEASIKVQTTYASSGGAITFCSCGRCLDLNSLAAGPSGERKCPHCDAVLVGPSVEVRREEGKSGFVKSNAKEAAQLLKEIEEREALEFKRAVEEWRSGKKSETPNSIDVPHKQTQPVIGGRSHQAHQASTGNGPNEPLTGKRKSEIFIPKPTYFSHLWSCVDSNNK